MIDFDGLKQRLDPAQLVPQWLPDGKRRGKEWVARNPTRDDRNPGSFSVCMIGDNAGTWGDFSTRDTGSDLISLYAYIRHNNDQGAAARELLEQFGDAPVVPAKPSTTVDHGTFVSREPRGAPKASFAHHELGEPDVVFTYNHSDGHRAFYVCRWNANEERGKEIRPLTLWERPDGTLRWRWAQPPESVKRSIYGLARLARYPDATVVVLEGEGKTDRVQMQLDDASHVVVSWLGGSSQAGNVDLAPLAGRHVVLVPDEDAQRVKLTPAERNAGVDPKSKPMLELAKQPSMKAMLALKKQLVGVAASCRIVPYDVGDRSSGWDLGDAVAEGWSREQILEHIAVERVPDEPDEPARDYVPWNTPINRYEFPVLSDKGAVANTIMNFEHLLNAYGVKARYNEMTKDVDIDIPSVDLGSDNRMNCAMAEIGSICSLNSVPRESRVEYIRRIADKHSFHPVRDWIESKPWDGVSRLQDLCATVRTTSAMEDDFKCLLIIRWLISAVAALYESEFAGHGALVFTGGQGKGKTSWFRALAPTHLKAVKDGAMLDPQDKDSLAISLSHWIVELGELDGTFRKADIARLKSFIPLKTDKFRKPYAAEASEYRRRTVFCGSVNDDHYLVDTTGNRRWWTIPVSSIDYQHTIDMQQVWAQVYKLYQEDNRWWLSPEEDAMLTDHNRSFEAIDPMEEQLLATFDFAEPLNVGPMTATQVLEKIGHERPTKQAANQMAALLRKYTGKDPVKGRQGARFFQVPWPKPS